MNALSSGSYNLNSFIPQDWRGWSDYQNRLSRYEVFEGYYHNIAYHSFMTYSQSLKVQERLYKHVRGVYNPINRLVEGYVSKVWGGVLDTTNGTGGAIPIDTKDTRLIEAIIQLWKASSWGQKKSLAVRYGAKLGDTVLQIVDDIQFQQVRIEAVDPAKVKTIDRNPDGSLSLVEFEYYIRRGNQNVLFCMSITPEKFSTKIEGQLTAVYTSGRGEQIPEWDNEYGFIPVVHIEHTDVGLGYGAPAAHGTLHKINELNDLASILNDGMRNQVNMPMITTGGRVESADYGTDRSANPNNTADDPKKDTMRVLNIPNADAKVFFASPAINIADGLANIREIEMELERDLPELALHRLRESGNLTAPGVRSAYDDAIARYREARGNYDTGLVLAHQMGVAIGGMRGYPGYQGFNLMSRENGALDHQIKDRPVISDSLSLAEKLDKTFMAMDKNAPKTVYTEMGWSETQADEIIQAAEDTQSRQEASAMRGLASAAFGNQPDEDEEDVIDGEAEANPPAKIVARSDEAA